MRKLLILLTLLLCANAFVMAQTVQITGTVTSSEDNLPIPGVTVQVKGTTIGAVSDVNGYYSLLLLQAVQTWCFHILE
jgi:hypothetical protein